MLYVPSSEISGVFPLLCTGFILGMIRRFLLQFCTSCPNRRRSREDKKESSPDLCLTARRAFPGTQWQIYLSTSVLSLKPIPAQGKAKAVIGISTETLHLELEMRSPAPDPLGGGVARSKPTKNSSNRTPHRSIVKEEEGVDIGCYCIF